MANGLGNGMAGAAAGGGTPERLWTGEDVAARLLRFYDEKTSTRAITRLQFVEQVGYLLFLKLDHERSQRPGRFARKSVAPEGTWPKLTDLSGDALHSGLTDLMRELDDQAPTRPDRRIAGMVFRDAQPWDLGRMAELAKLITEQIDPYQWRLIPQTELGQAFTIMLRHCREDIDRKIDTGQTLTPFPVLSAVVKVLDVGPDDIVIDPACGTGSTLIAAHQALQSTGSGRHRRSGPGCPDVQTRHPEHPVQHRPAVLRPYSGEARGHPHAQGSRGTSGQHPPHRGHL